MSSQEIKQTDSDKIIAEELLRYSSFYNEDDVYLDFSLNNYLIGFIKKNETDTTKVNYALIRSLNDEQIHSIFNKEEVISLIQNLNKNFEPNILSLPKNIKMDSEHQFTMIEELEKKRINLSYPAITKDNNYALIGYAYGTKNAMQGGVNVYIGSGNRWKFYKSIHLWVE